MPLLKRLIILFLLKSGLNESPDASAFHSQNSNLCQVRHRYLCTKSTFSDHRTLKLREAPDMVPVGELPRHIILSADRYNAAQVVPGSRVIATGIYYIFNSSNNKSAGVSALRTPYLRVVHLELSSPSASGAGGLNPFGVQFTPEEEKEFNEMARSE